LVIGLKQENKLVHQQEEKMKLSVYSLIVGIIGLIFGLGMIFLPYQVVSLYGTKLDVGGQFMARYFGSALLGLAVIFLTARNATTFEVLLKKGLLGAFVFGVSGLLVSIWDRIAGTHNALGWLNVILYGFFAVGWGYYYFKK